ncbi:PREDICTED: SPRY domain-containing SOCS box protein 3 [Ceratosolen solmsi marchali]|uniref:SPRY domain-containing SOCS box protein 3 n=1 Tax=Ceratosolen solmsi marchali TaxID=326594 RepID=A0AAJ6YXN0_9HYME|nr:PREDICTED: SPRY domain-containing SOCS box protein 3 [Ceratosolen solmsi marchali]
MSSGRHHYWEIKMITPVYGTDVMVGFGTKNVNLSEGTFCSPLGSNNESWGYSYRGYIQHNGQYESYLEHFKQGCLVGVYLDTWRGKLQFFMNRAPVGSAYTVLNELELYPMACSSSAKIIMKITYSSSLPVSLQTDCIPMLTPFQRIYLPLCFSGQHFLDVFADILKKLYDKAHNVHIYVESEIELSDESSSD